MSGIGFIGSIIIGGLAGWIAEKFMERDHSVLVNIILGIVGAMVFNFVISAVFGSTLGGWIGQLFSGFVGACALIAAAQWFKNR